MKRLLVIHHVPHERLGTFEPVFKHEDCTFRVLNAYEPKAVWPKVSDVQGVVVMGGPMGVYEQAKYRFLTREIALLREALEAQLPILGVCLGAQLLATVLGAKVKKNAQKEIGWYPIMREPGAEGDPLFKPFGQTETVFQWHGDTYELPKGCVRLAGSPLCREQGFRYRDNAYGVQFHLEVTDPIIRAWLQTAGNRAELAELRLPAPQRKTTQHAGDVIDPAAIRRQSAQHMGRLRELAGHMAVAFAALVKESTQQPSAVKLRPQQSLTRSRIAARSSSQGVADARRH